MAISQCEIVAAAAASALTSAWTSAIIALVGCKQATPCLHCKCFVGRVVTAGS